MTASEKYLQHLDNIFQTEPEFYQEESLTEGLPGVHIIVYRDIPEPGYLTAFTYGLSLVSHPSWKASRPELCISVESTDLIWAIAMGFLANTRRGEADFTYGSYVDMGAPISDESDMDAFFIFAPSTLEKDDYLYIDIGADYKISISGLYPMYSDELEVYKQIGLEQFWHHPDYDNYSVNRNHVKQ